MKRRTFLKIVSSAGVVSILSPILASQFYKSKSETPLLSLENEFLNPPFSSGVYTWWHWMNGNITKEGITRDLEAMKNNGIAGYQLFEAGTGIPTGPVESLSDEWTELIIHTIKESERLGLEFAMHNCPGWSSSGGPWITPDKAMQQLTWSETKVDGGKKIRLQLPLPEHQLNHYVDTYCLAFPSRLEVIPQVSIINLTDLLDKEGFLTWDAPDGEWTVMRFGQTARKQNNRSAPPKATGLECDKFSTKALDYHLECMFKRIMPMMEKMAKRAKVGLLIDSYEMGSQDWTYDMPAYFEKQRGYSLVTFMPALTHKIIESNEYTDRFLFDFKRTQADMFADRYYSHFQKRCKEKGIITYTEPYGGKMMEELQVAQRLDINMGEFWSAQTVLWANYKYNRTVKQVASIAHATGTKIVGAESFTAEADADKWLLYPYALKSLGDYMFTQGLSRIYFHRYAHQPHPTAMPGMTMGPWGLHFDRTNTWWKPGKAWINYLNRCQHIFQNSTFYADILYLRGDDTFGETIEPEKTHLAPPEGYDYDIVNPELLEKAYVRNHKIKLPGTRFEGYKLLVLLNSDSMSIHTLSTLSKLVKQGITLVGEKPQRSLSLLDGKKEEIFNQLVEEIWGASGSYEKADLKQLLLKSGLLPDFSYQSANNDNAAVHAIHYQQDETDIYFIANRRRITENGTAHFRIAKGTPELWNPYTAEIIHCPIYRKDNDGITIPLELNPAGSLFVVFRQTDESEHPTWTDFKYNGVSLFSSLKQAENTFHMQSNFSISCWIKPETDIAISEEHEMGDMRTRFFAVYPLNGEQRYGQGHSVVGLSVGRNGIVVYERSTSNKAVYRKALPLSGWLHLALIYQDNKPRIWINGEFAGEGTTSDNIVHYTVDTSDLLAKADTYEGEMCGFQTYPSTISEEQIIQIYQKGMPKLYQQENMFYSWYPEDKFIAWKTGTYEFINKRTCLRKQIEQLPARIALDGSWTLRFPEKKGAPKEIVLPELHSLRLEKDFGVRHFSGTITYSYTLPIPEEYLQEEYCLRLDLGRVEVIAEISVNGKYVTTCWAPPYCADIQTLLHKGDNIIEIRVTNLWVNRLIGDEYLPVENEYNYQKPVNKYVAAGNGGIKKLPEWYLNGQPKPDGGRVAFTTWKHYDQNSPLVESGLLGPVVLIPGIIETTK